MFWIEGYITKIQESTVFSFAVSNATLNISGQYYLMAGITGALGLQATALMTSLIKKRVRGN